MKSEFKYTGIRVRDLDGAVDFFTKAFGMKLESRVKASWNKGEFANLVTPGGTHWLELNWYADGSPVAGPFREGDELDHLGIQVDDLTATLERLKGLGCTVEMGPIKAGNWNFAFVKGIEGLWFDVFHLARPKRKKARPKKARTTKRRRKRKA